MTVAYFVVSSESMNRLLKRTVDVCSELGSARQGPVRSHGPQQSASEHLPDSGTGKVLHTRHYYTGLSARE